MTASQPFRVDVDKLMLVLERHLYSAPKVAVRELIANARDAILQRRHGGDSFQPCIELRVDQGAGTLAIRDNGTGMTRAQIEDGLATIAGSYTRLLRENEAGQSLPSDGLSGYFGLGFYASLMLSQEVSVTTRTALDGPALRWSCGGRPLAWSIEEEPVRWSGPGTEVTMRLRDEHRHTLGRPAVLAEEAQRYAGLVPFPIVLQGHGAVPLNPAPPWRTGDAPTDDYVRYARGRGLLLDDEEPLTVVPLEGCYGIEGVLWIMGERGAPARIELHVRDMLVGQLDDCLGGELSLAHGIVNCSYLPVTLSREDVLRGPEFERLQRELKSGLMRALGGMATGAPGSFHQVMAVHGPALKRDALDDDETFDAVAAGITVPVGLGRSPMTLDELIGHASANGKLLFMDQPETQAAYASLVEGRGQPVVNAAHPLDRALLMRAAQRRGLQVERVDVGVAGQLADEDTNGDWSQVEHLLCALDDSARVRITHLQPDDPPLLYAHTQTHLMAELLPQMEARVAAGEMGKDKFKVLRQMTMLKDHGRPLLINAAHPTMLALRSALRSGAPLTDLQWVARSLLGAAALFTENLPSDQRLQALRWMVGGSQRLLELLGGAPDGHGER